MDLRRLGLSGWMICPRMSFVSEYHFVLELHFAIERERIQTGCSGRNSITSLIFKSLHINN